jgi:carboxypeptidase family protein
VKLKTVPQLTCPQRMSAGWLSGNQKATWRRAAGLQGLWNRWYRASTVAGVLFGALATGLIPSGGHGRTCLQQAQAQNLGMRVVSGIVVDANSATMPGVTVFLKDLKSKNIRSFTSDAQGNYRFTQVNMAQDHELWAEKDGKKSVVKTVSSWDTRKEFVQELKLK